MGCLQNEGGGWTLKYLGEVLGSSYYRRVLGFTLLQALVSTLLSLLLAFPGAWILARLDLPGKRFLKGLTSLPFILPSILVVLGFILFWGRQGMVNSLLMGLLKRQEPLFEVLYSFKAILMAHSFYNFPIALRLIASWWKGLEEDQRGAARLLGASSGRAFWTLTFPQLLPGVFSAGGLVFLYCFMSFAIVLTLGGGPRLTTLEVEIYRLVHSSFDYQRGGALGLLGGGITLFLSWLYIRQGRLWTYPSGPGGTLRPWKSLGWGSRFFLLLYLGVVVILILGPLFTLLVQSFRVQGSWGDEGGWSLGWYRLLLDPGGDLGGLFVQRALINSLLLAGGTMILTLVGGTIIGWVLANHPPAGKSEILLMMPLGVSSVVLGLAYLDWGGLPRGLAILLAHTMIALPFALRTLLPGMRRIHQSLLEASRLMGASSFRGLRTITLPLMKPSLVSTGALSFAISLGELNATLVLGESRVLTIPLVLYRLVGSYRFYAACALGTVLMLICALAFWVIDRFELRELP